MIDLDCPSTVARHFANLFLRDPLYVTDRQVSSDQNNPTKLFAFEVFCYLDFSNSSFKKIEFRIKIRWFGIH